jgi:UDP-glucose 4-epimerase
MPERVLVTGAAGFIGRHLTPALQSSGFCVLAHGSGDGNIASCPLPYEDAGHVYHLAARSYVPDSWKAARDFYEVNVLGTVNVLELCRRTGASVTLLSSYVYGPPQFLPITEEHPVAAFNPYSHTKILAEQAGLYYARQFGVKVGILRPFNIYGPGQRAEFLIPTVIRQALSDSPQIEVADSRPRRDYLYIGDLVDLLLRMRGVEGVYNAGFGSSVSVSEVVSAVNSLVPNPKPLASRSAERPGEVLDVVAAIGKAREQLGWEPRVGLIDGLRAVIESGG